VWLVDVLLVLLIVVGAGCVLAAARRSGRLARRRDRRVDRGGLSG
jgi:hypothetical protein